MIREVMKGFDQVDEADDPGQLVQFLDKAAGMDAFKAIRQRMIGLLDVEVGQRILEIGCGTGEHSRELARLVSPTGTVVAVDKSAKMIAEAEKRSEGRDLPLHFQLGDATALDLDSESFDRCSIERTLIHVRETDAAICEMVRILRPGGRLVAFEGDFDAVVLHSAEHDINRRMLRFWCDSRNNGCIGRQLPALLKGVGLIEISFEARAVLYDFEFAQQVLLSGTPERAVEANAVTSEEARRWLSDLEMAQTEGTFVFAGMGFIVSARRP